MARAYTGPTFGVGKKRREAPGLGASGYPRVGRSQWSLHQRLRTWRSHVVNIVTPAIHNITPGPFENPVLSVVEGRVYFVTPVAPVTSFRAVSRSFPGTPDSVLLIKWMQYPPLP